MKSFFRQPEKLKKYFIAIVDLIFITICLLASFLYQMAIKGKLQTFFYPLQNLSVFTKVLAIFNIFLFFILVLILYGIIQIIINYCLGLYSFSVIINKHRLVKIAIYSSFFSNLLINILLGIFPDRILLYRIVIFQFVFTAISIIIIRLLTIRKIDRNRKYYIKLLGKDDLYEKALEYLNGKISKKLICIDTSENNDDFLEKDLSEKVKYDQIVFSAQSNKISSEQMISLVKLKFYGLVVCDTLTFYKNLTGSYPVFDLEPSKLIGISIFLNLTNQFQKRIKKTIDIVFSIIGIVITFPLMLIIGLAIKLTSDGPILYIHERLGMYEKPFRLYKFRTMVKNAEKVTGPIWAQKGDPRITGIGGFLRKTRLDELPQFFNVLKGDMSFIGPRPIRRFFADRLNEKFPYYFLRFYVKPGLTGWAQVYGDYGETEEEQLKKLEYELFYIHEYSLFMDMVIILKTIQKVFQAKGQ
jgi:exopolysaccharide biosynthesis polyprenyl glycosylphosphotransferase